METKSPPQNIQTTNKTQIQQKLQDDNIIFMIKRPISPQYQKSMMMIKPHDYLPKPEPPPGFSSSTNNNHPSLSLIHENPATVVSIGNFFREKTNSFSNAITKSLSVLKNNNNDEEEKILEINLPGVKVTKSLKQHKGRVSFFSRSNCRDCTAVRSFLKQRSLHYVEINIDVYPTKEKDLFERTGGFSVPQIFFNGDLIGGLVAFNSLRNGGMLDKKLDDILCVKCPDDAPKPPVYGLEEEDMEEEEDGMAGVVRVVRQKVPIRDRISKMKIVGNCFSGSDLVHALINHFHYGTRKKAVEIGKQLSLKHFIHHVFGENEFEDGNHLYRFLDHEPFIPKCHNFRGSLNDQEPKTASSVSQKLMILMSAIIETYASDDRRHLDYMGISNSEEFRRYLNLVEDLQRVNLLTLAEDERLAFFLNLYNSMTIHAVIRIGHPGDMIDRRTFFSDFMYVIGGSSYSLSSIMNGILRGNSRPPFSIVKPFSSGDKRLELTFPKMNQLIHFGTCNATRGSPSVKIFSSKSVGSELKNAAKEYFQREDGMQVDLAKRTVYLSRILKWYSTDFGSEKEIIKWVMNYLDATMAGLLTHLLSDGGTVNIVYQNFDWSLNC